MLDSVLAVIPASLSPVALALISFGASEVLMRAVPTAKPKSWLLVGSSAMKKVASILEKSSALLDQVIQNLKDDPTPPAPPAA